MFRTSAVRSLRTPRRTAFAVAAVSAVGAVLHENGVEQERLPIYAAPTPELVLLDTPSILETRIGEVRREVKKAYQGAHTQVQGVVSRWIGVEEAVESRIKSFRDPTEPVTPGLLYMGISTLTGSILARSRSLPTRIILPPTLFIAAFVHFLPKTASNVGDYAEELEDRYIPKFGEKRRIGVAHSRMGWERAKEGVATGQESFGKGVQGVVDKVQEVTGLKLGDALGRSREIKEEAKEVVRVAKEDLKEVIDSKDDESK
ncbi:hypothetical protein SERLADRAFT_459578 [Serpula lacrymans var. lacrymans S7.9]|uniref:MICOS complex subunit n=1 Tax=Serpula lacrymans var. lacrymans (strain S7.9) TaxID=578457 RepID=F8NKL0_SERL9|nr:uncharacterized protein SERLADRAFT_459578 [Serpula lacrymans var. lacrymans S7.9]EGO28782.1 hypothetical protein SERLADRAFT_459578 [Serpula lacrymans var. lacrymans S7.9]